MACKAHGPRVIGPAGALNRYVGSPQAAPIGRAPSRAGSAKGSNVLGPLTRLWTAEVWPDILRTRAQRSAVGGPERGGAFNGFSGVDLAALAIDSGPSVFACQLRFGILPRVMRRSRGPEWSNNETGYRLLQGPCKPMKETPAYIQVVGGLGRSGCGGRERTQTWGSFGHVCVPGLSQTGRSSVVAQCHGL